MSDGFVPPREFEEYRLVRPLGRGGMGQVHLAHDTLLDRPVAVKFIAAAAPDAGLRQQFFAEARALARLSHPNVVAVYRVGEVRRHPFLVSEFVRGQILSALPRPVPPEQVLAIALDLASGLAAAHRRGVLHRDLKPSNAIIATESPGAEESDPSFGSVKLLDFGLAQLFQPGLAGTTSAPAVLAGTPHYLAPELLEGASATPASDLYALGVLLFELLTGHTPHHGVPAAKLADVVLRRDAPSLSALAPACPPALVEVVQRCLAREPRLRPASASAVREELEPLRSRIGARALPAGNPYRGLATFEAEHRPLFFGRDPDVRSIVDRFRAEPFILVTGDSGVGKSSLCLAGVIPALTDEQPRRVARLVPGRRPLVTLAAALAAASGRPEPEITAELRDEPEALASRLTREGPLLVFVDQLEELLTLADPVEAETFAAAWAALSHLRPGLRLLATVRADFLARLASLGPLRELIGPALFVLGPLGPAGLRSAVVEPAAAKSGSFESPALVEELCRSVGQEPGGLPLLQFALASLWEDRDEKTGLVTERALAALGGVSGALARHADGVLSRLPPHDRAAARPLLTRFVTTEGTRRRISRAELVAVHPRAEVALEALVRGRLVVVRAAEDDEGALHEIAHEALLTRWQTLRGWLDEGTTSRAARERVARAAGEWTRLGRPSELLLSAPQLRELDRLPELGLDTTSAELVAASLAIHRRQRRRRWAAVVAGTLALGGLVLGVAAQARRSQSRSVARRLLEADEATAAARAESGRLGPLRSRALSRWQARDTAGGEQLWALALERRQARDAAWARAGAALEAALAVDPRRQDVRERMADLLFERASAEQQAGLRSELTARLAAYDGAGARQRRLLAPAEVVVDCQPPGATLTLSRYEPTAEGRLTLGLSRRLSAGSPVGHASVAAAPGSYLLSAAMPGRPEMEIRLPLLLLAGGSRQEKLELPPPEQIPAGFVHVPAGTFLYGSADDEDLRQGFLRAQPLHELYTGAYLIARQEVTFSEYIAFLDQLPAGEQEHRRPRATGRAHSLELRRQGRGEDARWHYEFGVTGLHVYRAAPGENLRYRSRVRREVQDWRRFPVAGISYGDAAAFTAWLDRSGKVPGARPCTEHEWERAARGADGRRFPFGERARADDMNHDRTYGQQPLAFGPDEVGSHPEGRSPFGLDDMAGNVWELTRSMANDGEAVSRGGAWYVSELSSRSANREPTDASMRLPDVGLRLCATPPTPRPALRDPDAATVGRN